MKKENPIVAAFRKLLQNKLRLPKQQKPLKRLSKQRLHRKKWRNP